MLQGVNLTASTWAELSELLDQALELPESSHAAWLDLLPEAQRGLRPTLEHLLRAHARANTADFLREPAVQTVDALNATGSTQALQTGEIVGCYRLLRELGAGGMGTVWLAERSDGLFKRPVALKLPLLMGARHFLAERFERERNILAGLDHPHIARLYDAGFAVSGQPYLAMEYVEGRSIVDHCDALRLTPRQRVELMLHVLEAVQYAHANLVLHRDLKPSNILVTPEGQVKLLDFGVAKLMHEGEAHDTRLTQLAGRALTPGYASPEQLMGRPLSTASDVFSLGVIAYELLAGVRPFEVGRAENALAMAAAYAHEALPLSKAVQSAPESEQRARLRSLTPARLAAELSGDLATIIAKAVMTNEAERYAAVAAFADDLRRYLAGEPVLARPLSVWYRLARFARREKLATGAIAAVFASIVAGLGATLWQAQETKAQRDLALRQLNRAQALNELNNFLLNDASPAGKPITIGTLLARAEEMVEKQYANDSELYVAMMLSIGHEYQAMGQHQKSVAVLGKTFERSRSLVDISLKGRANCVWAHVLAQDGKLKEAQTLIDEAMAWLPQLSPGDVDVECLLFAERVARRAGDAASAVRFIEDALARLRATDGYSKVRETKMLIDLAQSYFAAGNYRDAAHASRDAYERLNALGRGETFAAGVALSQWGLALETMGRPLQALSIYEQELALMRTQGEPDKPDPWTLVNIARTHALLNQHREALDKSERAYVIAAENGNKFAQNRALSVMAAAHRELGDTARAAQLIDEAEVWLKTTLPPNHYAFATLAAQRGLIADQRGDAKTGLFFLDQALSIEESAPQRSPNHAVHLIRRSAVRLNFGKQAEAHADAEAALALARQMAGGEALSCHAGAAYLALGNALHAQGKTAAAKSAYQSATTHLLDTVGPDHPHTLLATHLSK